MRKFVIVLSLVFSGSFFKLANAQDSVSLFRKTFHGCTEWQIHSGYFFSSLPVSPHSLFNKLAGDRQALSYPTLDASGNFGMAGAEGILGFGFRSNDKSKKGSSFLRLGAGYYGGPATSFYTFNETYTFLDTVTSGVTGEKVQFDSVFSDQWRFSYYSNQLFVTASVVHYSNRLARCSFYGGYGLKAGVTFNPYLFITRDTYSGHTVSVNSMRLTTNILDARYGEEKIRKRAGHLFSAFVTGGFNFRIAAHHPFWSRMYLIYELRLGYGINGVPEIPSPGVFMLQQSGGIRLINQASRPLK